MMLPISFVKKMKNQDFRAALFAEAKKKEAVKKKPARKFDSDDEDDFDVIDKGEDAHTAQPIREEKPDDTYIDRAALRRKMEKQTALSSDVLTFSQIVGAGQDVALSDAHLVTGLDSALLERTRREIESRRKPTTQGAESGPEIEKDEWAQKIGSEFLNSLTPFHSTFGKQVELIYKHLARGGVFKGKEGGFELLKDFVFNQVTSRRFAGCIICLMILKLPLSCLGVPPGQRMVCSSFTPLQSFPSDTLTGEPGTPSQDGPRVVLLDPQVIQRVNELCTVGAAKKPTHPSPPLHTSHTSGDEEDLFPDAGGLDTAELARKTLEERAEADLAEAARRQKVAKELRFEEIKDMEAAEALMRSAADLLKAEEETETRKETERKRMLERIEPVSSPEANPFSIKNASLITLIRPPSPPPKKRQKHSASS
eukprot:Blabericola_migrator_1__2003@NODE_1547_length_4305_cov_162_802029_g1014_i0_p1_GENE_NODE_1547_length_4305_cov_162_802029_g1014_i0NODE_1547_length_4305_cov_162_802029_g1014_i0_p1_ORF_typecomplete_len425_score111_57RED_N/PF07808_13/3_2e03RED_N/PF07808_13/2e07RED_N/PF07808_13/4_4e02_NODE_1547_length_4305_cov_162_802029_g1014_i012242498